MSDQSEPQRADRAVMRAEFQAMVFGNYTDEEIKAYMREAQKMGPHSPAHIRRNDHRG